LEQYQDPKARRLLRAVVTIKTMLPGLFRAIKTRTESTLMQWTIWTRMVNLTQTQLCACFLPLKE
jgi:hypothetical protein